MRAGAKCPWVHWKISGTSWQALFRVVELAVVTKCVLRAGEGRKCRGKEVAAEG